jgi:hypothetical protein
LLWANIDQEELPRRDNCKLEVTCDRKDQCLHSFGLCNGPRGPLVAILEKGNILKVQQLTSKVWLRDVLCETLRMLDFVKEEMKVIIIWPC